MHRIRKSSEGSDLKATTTNLFHSAIRLGEREMLVGSHSSLYLYAQACIFGFLWKKQIFSSTDAHFQYWWLNRETSCPYRPWKSSNCKSLQIIYTRKWREYFSFLPKACTPEITPISLLLWGIIQSFFFFLWLPKKWPERARERILSWSDRVATKILSQLTYWGCVLHQWVWGIEEEHKERPSLLRGIVEDTLSLVCTHTSPLPLSTHTCT